MSSTIKLLESMLSYLNEDEEKKLNSKLWNNDNREKRGPGNRGPTECGTTHEATSGMSS